MSDPLHPPPSPSGSAPAHALAWLPLLVFVATLSAQWLLWSNPGYFSHDEFQWAAAALQPNGAPVPWVSWFDVQAFQFRPLTFNAWLWLSHHLFERPQVLHAVIAAMGALNAALLAGLLRRLDVSPLAAVAAALMFALGPYAMYVHGWVGTIGDLIWLVCALLIGWVATLQGARPWAITLTAAALTVVALLAKEAALSIVALLTVACVIERGRMAWRWALLGVAVPSLLYLLLRFGVLTQVNDGDAAYAWSLANLPQRWLEYQAYGPQVSLFETQNTLSRGWSDPRFVVALLLWMALLAALTSAGWRWALALVAGGLAALGPVLVLDSASTQYGYGFAAFTAGLVAAAWPRIPYWGRAVVLLLALLNLWHGVNVMRQMRAVGEIQAVFSPAMVAALQADPVATLRLQPAPEADAWIFLRLTHHIPRIGDVAIGNRIRLVAPGEPTDTAHVDYVIEADGRLTLPRPLPSQR